MADESENTPEVVDVVTETDPLYEIIIGEEPQYGRRVGLWAHS